MKKNHSKRNALETQVERGSLFTHTALSKQATRLNEIESFLYAIIDVLTEKGITPPDDFQELVKRIRQEMVSNNEMAQTGLVLKEDEEGITKPNIVNCSERIHICQAVCCKLDFALSANEVESGKVKWDLGRPYMIRQRKDCYCVHNNMKNKKCSIYTDRPSFCKQYDCSKDARIWKDFEKMELNHEWINENIYEKKLVFSRSPLF